VLFLAFYETTLAKLDATVAKRLEWDTAAPPTIKILGEWVQHGSSEAIRGVIVLETDDPSDIQTVVLYWGDTVKLDIRPASDVKTAIERIKSAEGEA
jgi:hypothetical protein